MSSKKENTLTKKAILFVHGSYYFSFGSGIEIFEQKLDEDFADWKKTPNGNHGYSLQKDKSSVEILFHHWKDAAPFLNKRLLFVRVIDSIKTAFYFLFKIQTNPNYGKVRRLIVLTCIYLFLWIVGLFGAAYSILSGFIVIPNCLNLIFSFFSELILKIIYLDFALVSGVIIFIGSQINWSTICNIAYCLLVGIFVIRPFFPLTELMNLSFLLYAYEKNLYVDGVDCKKFLLTPIKRQILELLENNDFDKILIVGHSMGGVLITDAILDFEKTLDETRKEKIRSKVKVITTGSTHGLLNNSPTQLETLSPSNWDFYFCKNDTLSTRVSKEDAKPVEKFFNLSLTHRIIQATHLYYLREINYKEELKL